MSKWFETHIDEDLANAIVKVRVRMPNDRILERDLRPDLAIDYDLLEHQLTETPSIFVFWSSALAEQRRHSSSLERMIQRRRAKICESIIEDSKKEKYKVTQYMLEELVELDDDYLKLNAELVLAKRTESKLWAIVRAIEMKSDNLRTLAGFKKQEMKDIS